MYTRNLVTELLKQGTSHEFSLFGASLRRKDVLENFVKGLPKESSVKTCFLNLPPTFVEYLWNQIHHVKVEKLMGKLNVFHTSDWTEPPTKAKKVTTIHDLVVYKYPESSHPKIVAAQKRRLAWVKKESDLIIAVSESTKKDIVEVLGIPEKHIRVIYEAVGNDYLEFKNSSHPAKAKALSQIKQKYSLDRPYVLAVGTREPRKNLPRLISAFLKLNRPNLDLVIAGKVGWQNNNRYHSAEPILGNENHVKILGYVPQTELPALYGGAQSFFYPSLYEGFGLPVLEAFASGVPVITSKAASLPEIGGKAAIYVNPLKEADLVEKLADVLTLSSSARGRLIESGYHQLQNFSWEKTAQATLKVYEELA